LSKTVGIHVYYDECITGLANVYVPLVDRYELILQTIEYERAHNLELEEFFHVAERVQTPFMKDWVAEALDKRAHELKLTVGGAAN
jgi:hypothetical protein